MQSSRAREGYYTCVDVRVKLANEKLYDYRWTTPMGTMQAYHKAPSWAKEELARAKVRGRSSIVAIDVEVIERAGRYKK